MLLTAVIVDYQNVHLTAFDVFNPRGDRHDSLIHPIQFAKRALQERNARQGDGYEAAEVSRVIAFRGLHHVDHDWEQNRRAIDQSIQWRKDGVDVELRDLKYSYRMTANGKPVLDINGKKVSEGRPKEKGIDVLCALACVREAGKVDIDLVVLASRDTDLVPALDEVYDFRGADPDRYARIETVRGSTVDGAKKAGRAGEALKPLRPGRSGTPTWTVPAMKRRSTARPIAKSDPSSDRARPIGLSLAK